ANCSIVDPCGPALPGNSRAASSSAQVPAVAGPAPIANISVQSASISSNKVAPGAPVNIIVNVANTGTANGSTQVKLYVNGKEEARQGIAVPSGSKASVKFTVSRDDPGTYSVYAGNVPAGSFKVDAFTDRDILLLIGSSLILLAFILGAIYILRRRQQEY
ncbi:MAG: CARDB domain-containing protein, partial [Dehalococcoidia bacterium]